MRSIPLLLSSTLTMSIKLRIERTRDCQVKGNLLREERGNSKNTLNTGSEAYVDLEKDLLARAADQGSLIHALPVLLEEGLVQGLEDDGKARGQTQCRFNLGWSNISNDELGVTDPCPEKQ